MDTRTVARGRSLSIVFTICAALVLSEPHKFQMPAESDMRFNWVHADLAALDPAEARELVVDAWRMVVPKKVSRAYDVSHPIGPS